MCCQRKEKPRRETRMAAIPSVFIVGGSGKVARHLTRILVSEEKTPVHSLIRKAEQAPELSALGATPIVQSLEDSSVSQLASAIKASAAGAVVFSAGAGGGNPERTKAVDHEGAVKTFDAAVAAGVRRLVIVSAVDVRDRENKPVPDWYGLPENAGSKERSDRQWSAIGAYMAAKYAADRDLRTRNSERKLDYTIVRPGGLSLEPGTGKIQAGKVTLVPTIPREDVARTVVECLRPGSGTEGLAFDIVGGQTPIKSALETVVKNKIDTFEGHY